MAPWLKNIDFIACSYWYTFHLHLLLIYRYTYCYGVIFLAGYKGTSEQSQGLMMNYQEKFHCNHTSRGTVCQNVGCSFFTVPNWMAIFMPSNVSILLWHCNFEAVYHVMTKQGFMKITRKHIFSDR